MTFYQVTVKGEISGVSQVRNVHHYEFPDYVPTQANRQTFIDAFDSDLKTRLQSIFSTRVEIQGYDMRRVDIAEQPTLPMTATGGSWVGTASGHTLPAQVAGLVTFKAETAFPRSTRTYLFSFSEENNNEDGEVGATAQSAMTAWGGDILTIVIPGETSAVKVAVEYTAAPRIVADANVVQNVSVSSGRFATQRRRRVGVGT